MLSIYQCLKLRAYFRIISGYGLYSAYPYLYQSAQIAYQEIAGCIGGHKLGAILGGAQSRLLSGAAADVVVCACVWASIHTFSPVVMISPSPIVYTYLTSPANRTMLRFRNLGVFN